MSDAAGMINVGVDVAGFYYRPKNPVQIRSGSTVLDALNETRRRDIELYRNSEKNVDGKTQLIFDFSVEIDGDGRLFVNEIAILHIEFAESGQISYSDESGQSKSKRRTYPPGRYAYADDPVAIKQRVDGTIGFSRKDESPLPYALTWQYYLYDNNGVDLARAGREPRKVEPVSEKALTRNVTIVWRLIAILVKPTEESGTKGEAANSKQIA